MIERYKKPSNTTKYYCRLKSRLAKHMSQGAAVQKRSVFERNTSTLQERYWYMRKQINGRKFFHIEPSSRYVPKPIGQKQMDIRWKRNVRWWWHGLYTIGKGGLQRKFECRGKFLPGKRSLKRKRSTWKFKTIDARSLYKVNKVTHYP